MSLPVLVAASVGLSVGELLYMPARQTLLATLVPDDRRGAYLALHGQTFTLGKGLAALGVPLGAWVGGAGMAVVTVGLGGRDRGPAVPGRDGSRRPHAGHHQASTLHRGRAV